MRKLIIAALGGLLLLSPVAATKPADAHGYYSETDRLNRRELRHQRHYDRHYHGGHHGHHYRGRRHHGHYHGGHHRRPALVREFHRGADWCFYRGNRRGGWYC